MSTGSDARGMHPLAIAVMDKIGIIISGQRSRRADEFFQTDIDIVVKVCDCMHQTCPFFPGVRENDQCRFSGSLSL
jgi:arsenate reductase (thioredoxin)